MKEKIDSDLLKKYINGHYTFHDLKRIANWFNKDNYHDDIKQAIRSNWDEFDLNETNHKKDLSSVFEKLKNEILHKKRSSSWKNRTIKVYLRIAAVLLLPLLIYSLYSIKNQFIDQKSSTSWVEVISPYGARTHFDLPDGTKVTLNSGTHLKYNADFNKDRKLFIEGEAYFDVYHNASSPFVVQTEELNVKVLGTKFSIASIENDDIINVVLEEGKVQLIGRDNSFSEKLNPNESFSYNKVERNIKIIAVDAKYRTSWKDGLLVFRSEPLGEVLKRIGRWYNVRFEVIDPQINDFRYRATFIDEPLEEVLRLISLTAPIDYEIKKRKINIDNQYEESKVVKIRLKK